MVIQGVNSGLEGTSYVKMTTYFSHSYHTGKSEKEINNLLVKPRKKKNQEKKERREEEKRNKTCHPQIQKTNINCSVEVTMRDTWDK